MDRLLMPSAMPSERAEVLSDLARDLDDKALADARASMVELLCEGKQCVRITADQILAEDESDELVSIVLNLLLLDGNAEERALKVYDLQQRAVTLIESFVDSREDLIQTHAEELREAAREDV